VSGDLLAPKIGRFQGPSRHVNSIYIKQILFTSTLVNAIESLDDFEYFGNIYNGLPYNSEVSLHQEIRRREPVARRS
jgi:hypothetical protein